MTSQLEEEEEFVDGGAVLLDNDGPSFRSVSPPAYQRRSPPQRSVSESELTRVRGPQSAGGSQTLHRKIQFAQLNQLVFSPVSLEPSHGDQTGPAVPLELNECPSHSLVDPSQQNLRIYPGMDNQVLFMI